MTILATLAFTAAGFSALAVITDSALRLASVFDAIRGEAERSRA